MIKKKNFFFTDPTSAEIKEERLKFDCKYASFNYCAKQTATTS